jgi:hypothetical protein
MPSNEALAGAQPPDDAAKLDLATKLLFQLA